eukprot:628666-Rhodomonas_salina.1
MTRIAPPLFFDTTLSLRCTPQGFSASSAPFRTPLPFSLQPQQSLCYSSEPPLLPFFGATLSLSRSDLVSPPLLPPSTSRSDTAPPPPLRRFSVRLCLLSRTPLPLGRASSASASAEPLLPCRTPSSLAPPGQFVLGPQRGLSPPRTYPGC